MEYYPMLKNRVIKRNSAFYKYDIDGNTFSFTKSKDGTIGTVSVKLKYVSVLLFDNHSGNDPVEFRVQTLYSKETIPRLLGVMQYIYNYCMQIKNDIEEFFRECQR